MKWFNCRLLASNDCFKQAIGEDTKGKLMDEITAMGESAILKIIKSGTDKVEYKIYLLLISDSGGTNP